MIKTTTRTMALLIIVASFAPFAFAAESHTTTLDETNWILINNQSIKLNESKVDIEKRLTGLVEVVQLSSDNWVVMKRGERNVSKAVATLNFSDGKLESVSRPIGDFRGKSSEVMARALVLAVSHYEKTYKNKLTVEAFTSDNPVATESGLLFRDGCRYVRLAVAETPDGNVLAITAFEGLSKGGIPD